MDTHTLVVKRIVITSCAILVTFQFFLIPQINFNWDEFNELSHLFALESGFKIGIFRQGLHYLFWPLKYLPLPETTLLTLARFGTYFTGVLPTLCLVYLIGKKLRHALFGWIGVLCCLTFSVYLEASIQYRTDPVATALFLFALWGLLRKTASPAWLLPGLAMGLSLFLNPKAIFQFLMLSGVFGFFLLYGPNRKFLLLRCILFNLVGSLFFILLIAGHTLVYDLGWNAVTAHFQSTANVGFGATIGWDYKWTFIQTIFLSNPFGSLLFLGGLFFATQEAWRHFKTPHPATAIYLIVLAHLGVIMVYQGVHKYFAVNLIPVFAWMTALPLYHALHWLPSGTTDENAPKRLSAYATFLVTVVLLVGVGMRLPFLLTNTTHHQRYQNEMFNRLYPTAKHYGDGFGLLAKKNNVIQLLTGRRLFLYQKSGTSLLEPKHEELFPAFLIFSKRMPINALIQKDRQFLESHFLPYNDNKLWVHGRKFEKVELESGAILEIKVEGPYYFDGPLDGLFLNGNPVETTTTLTAGQHHLEYRSNDPSSLTVVYGNAPPDQVLPEITLPPRSSGTVAIPETQSWYPYSRDYPFVSNATIEQKPLAQVLPYEKQISISLSRGDAPYSNPSSRAIRLHTLGPLFYIEAHR